MVDSFLEAPKESAGKHSGARRRLPEVHELKFKTLKAFKDVHFLTFVMRKNKNREREGGIRNKKERKGWIFTSL